MNQEVLATFIRVDKIIARFYGHLRGYAETTSSFNASSGGLAPTPLVRGAFVLAEA